MSATRWANLAQRVVRNDFFAIVPNRDLSAYELWLQVNERLTPFVQDKIEEARAVRAACNLVVYMAGALTEASPADKYRYEVLSELVNSYEKPGARMFGYAPHMQGTDPAQHKDRLDLKHVTAKEVHDVDLLWSTFAAHLQLHCMWPVAHGNGAEAGWASVFGIPAVYFAPVGQRISRLMLGTHNQPVAFSYRDFDQDCVPAVRSLLDAVEVELLSS